MVGRGAPRAPGPALLPGVGAAEPPRLPWERRLRPGVIAASRLATLVAFRPASPRMRRPAPPSTPDTPVHPCPPSQCLPGQAGQGHRLKNAPVEEGRHSTGADDQIEHPPGEAPRPVRRAAGPRIERLRGGGRGEQRVRGGVAVVPGAPVLAHDADVLGAVFRFCLPLLLLSGGQAVPRVRAVSVHCTRSARAPKEGQKEIPETPSPANRARFSDPDNGGVWQRRRRLRPALRAQGPRGRCRAPGLGDRGEGGHAVPPTPRAAASRHPTTRSDPICAILPTPQVRGIVACELGIVTSSRDKTVKLWVEGGNCYELQSTMVRACARETLLLSLSKPVDRARAVPPCWPSACGASAPPFPPPPARPATWAPTRRSATPTLWAR
jgi:hypothetical protein